ncbi:MAG: galactose-1-phosphate uridylyltransferase [Gammaproteobacteria bacterium]|nr:galactose-1-phosphate uridylyltransferase [Gammaproteobacteria bacterium]
MHELILRKPDGRALTLYSRRPIPAQIHATAVPGEGGGAAPHLRWHPLRGEWVVYAPQRQERTFLPPPQFNPLRPATDARYPTEVPEGDYDVAVFDNLFPALSAQAPPPPELLVPTASAHGHCEVVVFTRDPASSLGALALDHLALLLEVWGRRTQVLGADPRVKYVLPFENRGAEVGVTLHHPHGQIYAYPFVPPVPARMQALQLEHYARAGEGLLEGLIAGELRESRRMLYQGTEAVAFVPVCARYPYEVWVAPRRPCPGFADLSAAERLDLARALKTTLLKYDGLWQRPFPYVLIWYQAPLDDTARGAYHLHAALSPSYRMPGRLKYLAGTELGAGTFVNDALPEEKARELQAVAVSV